jgi:hypothetical protein
VVEQAPTRMSKLVGAVGIAAIALIGVVHGFLIVTNRVYTGTYWDSLWPLASMALITAIVGVVCYIDRRAEPETPQVFRPFFWCLGLTIAYVPCVFIAGGVGYFSHIIDRILSRDTP